MQAATRLPGFTYIELIVVMGIVALLSTLVTVVSMSAMTRSQVHAQIDLLLSDVAYQQQLAANRVISSEENQHYGVYFYEDGYILFEGEVYEPDKSTNQHVELPIGMKITSINLPQQQLAFSEKTGFVMNWQASQSGIIVTSPLGKTTALTINRYGVIEVTQ